MPNDYIWSSPILQIFLILENKIIYHINLKVKKYISFIADEIEHPFIVKWKKTLRRWETEGKLYNLINGTLYLPPKHNNWVYSLYHFKKMLHLIAISVEHFIRNANQHNKALKINYKKSN